MKRHILTFLITLLVAALFACSYENTATVTIDTGIRQQAQLSWFDRVLAFFSLAQPLQADQPQNVSFDVLELSITAADMTPIILRYTIEELYNNYGKITVEVPSGSQRVFTIVAGNSEGQEIYNRIYGGVRTVDLAPGQQVNLNIEIGDLPVINYGSISSYNNNNALLIEYYVNNNPPIYFKIYKINFEIQPYQYLLYNIYSVNSLPFDDYGEVLIYYCVDSYFSTENAPFAVLPINQYGEGNMIEIWE